MSEKSLYESKILSRLASETDKNTSGIHVLVC